MFMFIRLFPLTSKSARRCTIVVALCSLVVGCNSSVDSPRENSLGDVLEVTDQSFEREVLEADEPVLVDMWAPWCQPCVEMKPALRAAGEHLRGEIKVVEVNVQANPFVDEKYGIEQLPTLMLFVEGRLVKQDVGRRSLDGLLEFVQFYRLEKNGSKDSEKEQAKTDPREQIP